MKATIFIQLIKIGNSHLQKTVIVTRKQQWVYGHINMLKNSAAFNEMKIV
jgi:hypothetical protein